MRLQTFHSALMIVAIVLAIPLFIYLYAAVYVRYVADDYCLINAVREQGVFGTVRWYYFNWTGRFSSMGSVAAALTTGLRAGSWLIIGAVGAWWVALWGIVRCVARRRQWPFPTLYAANAASLFLLTLLNSSVSLMQSIYWLSGLLLYTAPLILFTAYGWLICRAWPGEAQRQKPALRWFVLILCAALSFFAAGYSETFGSVQTIVLAGISLLCALNPTRRALLLHLLAGLIGSTLGLILTMVAPGNSVRFALSSVSPEPLTVVLGTLISPVAVAGFTTLVWPPTLIVLAMFPAFTAYYFEQDRRRIPRSIMRLIPVVVGTLIAVCFFPSLLITATAPPERAWIIPQIILFVGIILWSYLWGWAIKPGQPISRISLRVQVMLVVLVVVVAFTSVVRAGGAVRDLSSYATVWEARDDSIRARISAGEIGLDTSPWMSPYDWRIDVSSRPSLIVAPLPNPYGLADITPNPSEWSNKCIARYYGIPAIKAPPLNDSGQ